MDLMITLLGTDTVRSTDFPVHWLKRQAPGQGTSQYKVTSSSLYVDTNIKLSFPTADNKAWGLGGNIFMRQQKGSNV